LIHKISRILPDGSAIRRWLSSKQVRRLVGATASGGAARIVTMLVVFATVPLALDYLGPERYGLWMAVTALVFMLTSFADGGVSNALTTAAATANAKTGFAGVRKVLGSGAAIIVPVALLLILVSLVVVPLVSWQWVFNLQSEQMAREAAATVLVIVTSIGVGFVANLVIKMRIGLQEIPAVSAWDIGAALGVLPMVLLVIHLRLNMVWLVAAVVGMPILIKALGSLLFLWRTPMLVPRIGDIDLAHARDLLGGGSVFFVIVLTQALAIQSDQILIANLTGVEQVATYSIVQRLFTIPYILANFLFVAQWPAFSAAAARGDHDWIRQTFWRTLLTVAVLAAGLSLALLFIHKPILQLWVGDTIQPSALLVAGMAAYAILLVIVGACSTLLVSLDVRRPQIWINISMLVVNLPLSIYLIPRIGASGAIIGTAVSYLLCMVIPYAIIIPKLLARMSTQQPEDNGGEQLSKTVENKAS